MPNYYRPPPFMQGRQGLALHPMRRNAAHLLAFMGLRLRKSPSRRGHLIPRRTLLSHTHT